jgi:hypothetical protein
MLSTARQLARHVLPSVVRPIRVLWNEVIGFVFLALALWSVRSAINAYREFDGGMEGFFKVAMTWFFTILMGAFGIHSFLRARRISRSS